MYLTKRIVIFTVFCEWFLGIIAFILQDCKGAKLPISYDFEKVITDWYIRSGDWSVQNELGSKGLAHRYKNICHTSVESRIGNSNWTDYEINLIYSPLGLIERLLLEQQTNELPHLVSNLPVAYALHMSSNYVTMQSLLVGLTILKNITVILVEVFH